MKVSDDLFQLVHSLDQGEKWYFKRYADRHQKGGDKNYIRLFEAIERQAGYNEAALLRKFSKEVFTRQFSVAKNYLYQLIMDSLTIYHQRDSVQQQVLRLIHGVEILYAKGLFHLAQKRLRKAQRLAKGHDLPLEQLRLVQWEQNLVLPQVPLNIQEGKYDRLGEEESELLESYRADREIIRLGRKWSALIAQYGMPRSRQEVKRYEPLINHPLLQQGAVIPQSEGAVSLYHYMLSGIYWIQGKHLEQYRLARALFDRLEASTAIANKTKWIDNYYVNALTNVLAASVNIHRYDDYFFENKEWLRKLAFGQHEFKLASDNVLPSCFVYYYNLVLEYHMDIADFEEASSISHLLAADLPRYVGKVESISLTDLYINMGLYLFYAGQFTEALGWFNRLLSHPHISKREDVYGWVKIMCLIIHFELGHERMLEYSMKTTYYYLTKMMRLYRTEKKVLQFFKKDISRLLNQKELHLALQELHSALVKIQHDSFEKHILELFDIISWLESRIEGRPLPDVIREKRQLRMDNKKARH